MVDTERIHLISLFLDREWKGRDSLAMERCHGGVWSGGEIEGFHVENAMQIFAAHLEGSSCLQGSESVERESFVGGYSNWGGSVCGVPRVRLDWYGANDLFR